MYAGARPSLELRGDGAGRWPQMQAVVFLVCVPSLNWPLPWRLEKSPALLQLRRLTLVCSEVAQVSAAEKANTLRPWYHLLAVRPTTEEAFRAACEKGVCDIISLLDEKLPFPMRRKDLLSFTSRGGLFELELGPALRDAGRRRALLANAELLVHALRGRHVIFSSGAQDPMEMRCPQDLANFAGVLGLRTGHMSVSEVPYRALQRGVMRRGASQVLALDVDMEPESEKRSACVLEAKIDSEIAGSESSPARLASAWAMLYEGMSRGITQDDEAEDWGQGRGQSSRAFMEELCANLGGYRARGPALRSPMAPRAGSRLAEALKAGQVLKKEEIHQLFGAEGASVLYASVKATADGEVEGQELLQWLYKEDGTSSIPLEGELTSPRHTEQEIEKLGGLMELSASQEAVEEFKAMAKNLAREFKEKVAHPNAEAFIEQLCVEKILKGALFVGHVKTDLDSVAGAIGGACLYQGTACRAERELNGEIMYALRWAGLEMPPYFDDLPGAMEPDAEGNLKSICLVDHNEDKQMVPSLRDAKDRKKRIIGLIDHHALAESMASEKPLFMDVRPWGSMSSIVAHAFIRGNRMIPKPVARILLAAILSDTLNLQSVTTTNADRFLVTVLCILGECEDPDQLARAMFRAKTEWIVNLGAYEMTRGDQKDFTASGWKVGIAVLEVTDTCPVLKVAEELLMELRILKVEKGQLQEGKHDRRKELDFAYLFVVDVTKQESFLLIAGGRELALAKEAFPGKRLREAKEGILAPGDTIQADETLMEVGGLVSRKAQFVPAFLSALNGGFSCHKQPNSLIAEELAGIREEDEVTEAIDAMQKDSFHDSVQVVRDYTRYRHALDTLIVRKSIIAQGL
ncbi:unnamed protein product [Effrenium voratum]|nr:unnamed protein product [Effrenium voratum]